MAALVAAPWYAAMTLVHGRTYLDSFFVGDNLERFATTRFNDPRPMWFYLPITVGGMLPWTPLALAAIPPIVNWREGAPPAGVAHVAHARRGRSCRWLFFTASIGKQPRYILPILPPLAVLLAATIMDRVRARSGRDALLQGPAAIVAALLGGACVPALPGAARRRRGADGLRASRRSSRSPSPRRSCWRAALAPRARVVPAAVALPARSRWRGCSTGCRRRTRPRAGHGHAGHCAHRTAAGADCHVPRVRAEPGLLHAASSRRPAQRSSRSSITCTRPSACCA